MIQEEPSARCLEHSDLPREVVSIRKGALQYTDVFPAGLLPEKAAWEIGKTWTQINNHHKICRFWTQMAPQRLYMSSVASRKWLCLPGCPFSHL